MQPSNRYLTNMKDPVIIVHGGAWAIPDRLIEVNINGVEDATRKGWKILGQGGSALDAVVAAVNCLEDNPVFDAGIGSVLTEDGTVEMDARCPVPK
jgi:beta-aspartyl-peptidase (threonine type)